jgi:hypothetical protein
MCCETNVYSVHSLCKRAPEKFKSIRGSYNFVLKDVTEHLTLTRICRRGHHVFIELFVNIRDCILLEQTVRLREQT